MSTLGTIGLVNGGGDAPGLNAVTRAVVRTTYYRLKEMGSEVLVATSRGGEMNRT